MYRKTRPEQSPKGRREQASGPHRHAEGAAYLEAGAPRQTRQTGRGAPSWPSLPTKMRRIEPSTRPRPHVWPRAPVRRVPSASHPFFRQARRQNEIDRPRPGHTQARRPSSVTERHGRASGLSVDGDAVWSHSKVGPAAVVPSGVVPVGGRPHVPARPKSPRGRRACAEGGEVSGGGPAPARTDSAFVALHLLHGAGRPLQ